MTDNPVFRTSVCRRDSSTEVLLYGELDLATAPDLWTCIESVLVGGDTTSLVLDLAGVAFIDSSGLNTIIRAHNTMVGTGGSLVLRSPSRIVQRLLDIAGVDRILTVEAPEPNPI